jgi:hypothetical protein
MPVWSPQQNEALSKAAAWLRLRYAPTFYRWLYTAVTRASDHLTLVM